ncbi:MAG TPA: sulfate ABC transporter permease subunit [Gaiellaceae bacterium]|nr:sulfate ABC transporter permease subunit [Gaiellaceae bacterium]
MTVSRRTRYGIRVFSLGYLALILVAPVGLIFWRSFDHGWHPFWAAVSNHDAVHALKLTVEVTAIVVPLNTAFGILCALAIVRHRIPGMGLVNAIVDLPMALSPVVVGLSLYLLYARDGWFGSWLLGHGVRILFALPAILLATAFVSLPFVVREVVPVLREIGIEQEEAAATLGSSAFTTFRRVTLPAIRWAVAYGVVLTTARSLGEFGAVSIVSGGIAGRTQTLTQYVQASYENFSLTGAYAASVELAMLAIATLLVMTMLKPRRGGHIGNRGA